MKTRFASMSRRPRRRPLRWLGALLAVLLAVLAGVAAIAGFFDRDPIRFIGDFGRARTPLATVFFSGDMGLNFGMGRPVTRALAAHGLPVLGVNSPTIFRRHRTRAEVDTVVADAVREALAHAHADRIVLIGQSFGSDMLATGSAALPADLRAKVAAIVLVVPGRTVFFRADPTELAYRGTPDGQAIDTMRTVSWAPVTCISGQRETDSLCPLLKGPHVRGIVLPGGHFLNNDPGRLIATIVAALRPILPAGTNA